MQRLFVIFLTAFLFLPAAKVTAETQYINDEVRVPVRTGAGNGFRIIHKGIKSGTKLNVKEISEDGDWAHIVTEGGLEGWVRKQYLSKQPTAALLVNQAQLTAEKKSAQVAYLQNELKALQEKLDNVGSTCKTIENNKNTCDLELKELRALSTDAIRLNDRYQTLLTEHELIKTEFDSLQAENSSLRSDSTINQWMVGAALVLLGVVLALLVPSLRGKKNQSEWRN